MPAEEATCEDLERFAICDDPEKFFQVSAQLPPQEKEELVEFLKKNVDFFTWSESKFHMSSFECQSINHPQEATISAFI